MTTYFRTTQKTMTRWTIYFLTTIFLLLDYPSIGQVDTLIHKGQMKDGLLHTPRPDSLAKKDSVKYFAKYPEYYNTKLYNFRRQLIKDGVFKKDTLITGKEYVYNNGGWLIQIKVFKNGKYIGDTTIAQSNISFVIQRNDSNFYYRRDTLIIVSINLPKGEVKSIIYNPSGKIESIAFTRPNNAKNGYESIRTSMGYYENGAVRYKAKQRKGQTTGKSYIYYQNGKVQCKTYWNKHGEKKRQICYDEKGNKTNDVKILGANDVRIDECNCDD